MNGMTSLVMNGREVMPFVCMPLLNAELHTWSSYERVCRALFGDEEARSHAIHASSRAHTQGRGERERIPIFGHLGETH